MKDRTAAVPFRATSRRGAAVLAGLMLAVGGVAACGPDKSASAGPTASPSPSASASASGSPSGSPSGAPSASPTPSSAPTPPATPPASSGGSGTAPGGTAPGGAKITANSYQVANNTQLTVWFYGGICDKYGLTTDESAAGQVRVRVVVVQPAPRGQACPALAKSESVSADLKQPLDGRKVVDLSSGAALPMGGDTPGGPR